MLRFILVRISLATILVTALSAPAPAVTIKLSVFRPDFGPKVKSPCPRGDSSDVCSLKSYLYSGPGAERNNIDPIFSKGWAGFLVTHPGWTLINGGPLSGTIDIWQFRTFNDCPDGGGVEIRAKFRPGTGDPQEIWCWAQALDDNYVTGQGVPPHNSAPLPPIHEMDGKKPPGYPAAYDGDFYDKPTGFCIHNSTVYFHAVALLAQILPQSKRLITYEGFEYGWDYTCVHSPVPEPASIWVFGLGFGAFVLTRRRRSFAQERKV